MALSSLAVPTQCALIADVVSRKLWRFAIGYYNTRVYTGMMLISVGMGPVIRGEGFRVGFLLSGMAVVIVMFMSRFLYRRESASCLPQANIPS
jgi:MFS transporter, DHA1 family, multidrug resistance protein